MTTASGNVSLTTTAGATAGQLTINDATNGISASGKTVSLTSAAGVIETGRQRHAPAACNCKGRAPSTFAEQQRRHPGGEHQRRAVTFNDGSNSLTVGTVGDQRHQHPGQNLRLSSGNLTIEPEHHATGRHRGHQRHRRSETGTAAISAGSLRLQGTGAFSLNNNNTLSTLAANVTGDLSLTDTANLTVGTVNGTAGAARTAAT